MDGLSFGHELNRYCGNGGCVRARSFEFTLARQEEFCDGMFLMLNGPKESKTCNCCQSMHCKDHMA